MIVISGQLIQCTVIVIELKFAVVLITVYIIWYSVLLGGSWKIIFTVDNSRCVILEIWRK